MGKLNAFIALALCSYSAQAACPYMDHDTPSLAPRDEPSGSTQPFPNDVLEQFEVDDTDVYLTSAAGVPIEDQETLSAGERGPTLLEDFIFREKIMHFGKELS